jgi:hypothetical protein
VDKLASVHVFGCLGSRGRCTDGVVLGSLFFLFRSKFDGWSRLREACIIGDVMRTLLVGYDLNKAGQDYDDLIDVLETFDHWHDLDSTWLIRTDETPTAVRDNLKRFLDSNDELLVIDVSGDAAAWTGFSASANAWIKAALQGK